MQLEGYEDEKSDTMNKRMMLIGLVAFVLGAGLMFLVALRYMRPSTLAVIPVQIPVATSTQQTVSTVKPDGYKECSEIRDEPATFTPVGLIALDKYNHNRLCAWEGQDKGFVVYVPQEAPVTPNATSTR